MRLFLVLSLLLLCVMTCTATHKKDNHDVEIDAVTVLRERRDAESDEYELDDEEDVEVEDEDDHEAEDPDPDWYTSPGEDVHSDDVHGPYMMTKQQRKARRKALWQRNNRKNKQTGNKKNTKGKKTDGETLRNREKFITSTLTTEEKRDATIQALGRQLMLQQLYIEEKTRSDGSSGIKQVRVNSGGTRPYHWAHHTSRSVASIHEHANNIRTVGMGEFVGVLNGVEFRTRHNDYRLKQPHETDSTYHATEDIEFPGVPQEVTDLETVEEQIKEMRIWFKAFKDQNITLRDYRSYFPAVLCYLEGAWTLADQDKIDEPFDSDRHIIDASSWFDLQEKIRFTSATGRKSQLENFAYLPTTIIEMVNGTDPRFAQWNYRIMCHKVSKDVPLNRLRPVDNLAPRFSHQYTFDKYLKSRAALFQLHDHHHQLEKQERATFLDSLMYEIPGKDNYQGNLLDTAMGSTVYHINGDGSQTVNAARYHRYFIVDDKGAMGLKTRKRGFSDPNLFVALTTQEKIAPFSYEECTGRRRNRVCTTITQRVSYAVPLEIIYLSPLSEWNPLNIKYKSEFNSIEGKTVNAINEAGQRRNGMKTVEQAYNGSNSKLYYRTPASFFKSQEGVREPADTTRSSVGVLDKDGEVQIMMASGTRIHFPEIEGVGSIRQRYPIMPTHRDGHSIEKQVSALEDALMQIQKYLPLFRDIPPFQGVDVPELPKTYTFYTSVSHKPNIVDNHWHQFTMTDEEFTSLKMSGKKTFTTSYDNQHEHVIEVRYQKKNEYFIMVTCGGATRCWDDHDRKLYYSED